MEAREEPQGEEDQCVVRVAMARVTVFPALEPGGVGLAGGNLSRGGGGTWAEARSLRVLTWRMSVIEPGMCCDRKIEEPQYPDAWRSVKCFW